MGNNALSLTYTRSNALFRARLTASFPGKFSGIIMLYTRGRVWNNLAYGIINATRCAVTSACNNPFNVRFTKRALRASHTKRLRCFVKPFGVHYAANCTRRGASRVSPAYTCACRYTCTLDKLFDCAVRHGQATIIINLLFSLCSSRINQRPYYGCFAAVNVFILALSGPTSVINDEVLWLKTCRKLPQERQFFKCSFEMAHYFRSELYRE